MSALVDIEKEIETLDPEDALHIQRAVMEMLQIARRKTVGRQFTGSGDAVSHLPAFSMGAFQPGIDPHKLGQLSDEF